MIMNGERRAVVNPREVGTCLLHELTAQPNAAGLTIAGNVISHMFDGSVDADGSLRELLDRGVCVNRRLRKDLLGFLGFSLRSKSKQQWYESLNHQERRYCRT